MPTLDERDIQQHVTILGWVYIAGHVLFLVLAVCAFVLLPTIGALADDPEGVAVITVIGSAFGVLMALLGLPGLLAGYGLLKGKPWARYLALVIGLLNLANFPIGTVIGVYTLWVLLQESATAFFARQQPA